MTQLRLARYDPSLATGGPFQHIDYVRSLPIRLQPEYIFDKGVLVRLNYWDSAEVDTETGIVTFSDLVVREDYQYTRDENMTAQSRVLIITWFNEDDSPHPETKTRVKVYSPIEAMREAIRRRRNNIDRMKYDTFYWLLANGFSKVEAHFEGEQFFDSYQGEASTYQEIGSAGLHNAISSDSTFAWLDLEAMPGTSIREVLMGELT